MEEKECDMVEHVKKMKKNKEQEGDGHFLLRDGGLSKVDNHFYIFLDDCPIEAETEMYWTTVQMKLEGRLDDHRNPE